MVFTFKKMCYDCPDTRLFCFLKKYKILALQSTIMTNMSYFCELHVWHIWEILLRWHQNLKAKFVFIHRSKTLTTFPHPINWTSRKAMKWGTFYFNKWLQGLLSPRQQECGKKSSPLVPQKQRPVPSSSCLVSRFSCLVPWCDELWLYEWHLL